MSDREYKNWKPVIDYEGIAEGSWGVDVYDAVILGTIPGPDKIINPSILFQCPECNKWFYWSQLTYTTTACDHDAVICPDCNWLTDLWRDRYHEIGYVVYLKDILGGMWDYVA